MTGKIDPNWIQGVGGSTRWETHYDGRTMLCYTERPASLTEMLADCVRRFPDRPAIVEDGTLTYRDLDRIVTGLATGLSRLGVGKGSAVAVLMTNRWQVLATVFACARLGAVSLPLSARLAQTEVEFMLSDSATSVILFESRLANILPDWGAVPSLKHRVCVDGTPDGALPFDDIVVEGDPVPSVQVEEEDTTILLYTSGTTGKPKGATLTHLGIVHSALTFPRCFGLDENDRAMVAVPLSHVTGLVGVALSILAVGGCAVLMRESFQRHAFLELASRERITFSILVPTIYSLIAMMPELDDCDLSSWRIGGFGGAPMPVATIERIAEKLPNLLLLNAYGATETTSPTTAMPLSEWRGHMDSVGKVVPCGHVRVVDEDGQEVPPGEPGELMISGPMVVPGYLNRPDANAAEFVDGYWRSGDIGSMNADGFVRVFDRRKEMINRGGFKVFSAEVENKLNLHDSVLECAVVGVPDPVLGERVHAYVVARDGYAIDEEVLRAYCTAQMSDYKRPETYTIMADPLPRNNNGKVQKRQLREALVN
ncbi:class I adenylate-forming enzyme family protein [Chachezhania sediminis]|uniref:class I adenylate-forming enzyme family protein n=1 Tax=Chachezhania sediminis TaxID=2599291 RepID=UPI00131B15ED|nr:class I adenylate-forming enzyme family protein [Chachezhania sediminis]